jgi:Ca2+/Na+ antiporter
MEDHNVFIIILIIILLFFLSADKNITSESLDHNTIPLLLILIIFYFCINNISLGILLISIIFLVLSTTDMKKIITERMGHYIDNTSLKSGIEQFGLMINKKDILKKAKEYADKKKDKELEEKEKVRIERDEKAEKSKNLLYKNEEYKSVSYGDFKEEVDEFNNVDKIDTNKIKEENRVQLPVKKKSKDLDLLMNKLDNDVNNL